jgi:hypothetical protein
MDRLHPLMLQKSSRFKGDYKPIENRVLHLQDVFINDNTMATLAALTSRFGRMAVCHARQIGAPTVQQASRQAVAGPSRMAPMVARQFSASPVAQATMNQGEHCWSVRGELELKNGSMDSLSSCPRMSKEGPKAIQGPAARRMLPEESRHLQGLHDETKEAQLGRAESLSSQAVNGEHDYCVYSRRGTQLAGT